MKLNEFLIVNCFTDSQVVEVECSTTDYGKINLSATSTELAKIDVSSSKALEQFIDSWKQKGAIKVPYGGYLEKRAIYQRSTYFNEQVDKADERNIHLGIDLWLEEGTTVYSALDGKIHSFKNNLNHGDYGPTIIIEHKISEIKFYTLYGHLSIASLENLFVGKEVNKGEIIGQLGGPDVNGDYPPHLHFQIILDLQNNFGDYPGVCSSNELSFYKQNCPDPNLILGLD